MRKSGLKKMYPRIYKTWQSIRQRCNNPNAKDYFYYGGRGIIVCEDWNKTPDAFVAWAISNGYEKTNKTGVNGVHWDRSKYRAIIYVDNRKIDLGRYVTLEEAAAARKRGEARYWGVIA